MRFIFVFLWLALGLSHQLQGKELFLSQKGILPGDTIDATKLLSILQGASKRGEQVTVRLEPGTYYLTTSKSLRRMLYISNHDQLKAPRPVGILLEGLEGLTLDGMGSKLICLEDMLPMAVINSKRVRIKGLTIDFREPTIHQSRILENRGEGGIVFAPDSTMRSGITPEGRWVGYGENWQESFGLGIAFDPKTRHILYRVSDIGYNTQGATDLGGGRILAPKWQDARLPAGTVVAMRSYKRPYPGIFVDASRDTELERVVVHYASGMGLLAQNSHNISLKGFEVRPASGRYYATQADATHFSGCSGVVEVRDGHFEAMMDDAINVHGVYLKLIERRDDRTLVGQYMHNQAWGFAWGKAGDRVQFVSSRTFDVLASNSIQSIEPLGQKEVAGAKAFVIRFRDKLPKELTPEAGFGIENLSKEPSVRFVGNVIRNNRARGTLINTSKPVLIEGNHFDHISGSAILVSSDCNQWYESGRTGQMTIRGNVFEDVLTSLYQFTEAVISLCPVIPDLQGQRSPFYGAGRGGIVIEDNVFKTFDIPLLFARSSEAIVWRGNRVTPTKSYPPYHHRKEVFTLEGSKPLVIEP